MRLILFISSVILGITFVAAASVDEEKGFKLYKQQFNKTYNNTDNNGDKKSENKAKENYLKNAAKVKAHNADSTATYKQGWIFRIWISEFVFDGFFSNENPESDPAIKQHLKKTNLKGNKNKNLKSSANGNSIDPSLFALKASGLKQTDDRKLKAANAPSMDLRPKMSPVKAQKACGACWAFSAVALLEFESRMNGTNLFFSEQSLVDCDMIDKGCDGGNPLYALLWARMVGISQEKVYGYTGKKGVCKTVDKANNYSSPYNFCYMVGESENTLVNAMNKYKRPFAVGIHTKGTGFDVYSKGVFFDSKCSSDPKLGDHSVVGE
jgi:cathepsin L